MNQRESTFRIDPVVVTDKEVKRQMQIIRNRAADLYDAIQKLTHNAALSSPQVNNETLRCIALAETKIQESVFWAMRGASYVGTQWSE